MLFLSGNCLLFFSHHYRIIHRKSALPQSNGRAIHHYPCVDVSIPVYKQQSNQHYKWTRTHNLLLSVQYHQPSHQTLQRISCHSCIWNTRISVGTSGKSTCLIYVMHPAFKKDCAMRNLRVQADCKAVISSLLHKKAVPK